MITSTNFWVKKLKLLSGNKRQSYQNYLNPRLIIGGISENGFETTLRSKKKKKNVLNIWKLHFSVTFKFLSNFVIVFWKSEMWWEMCFGNFLYKVSFVVSFSENAFQLLFDLFRQSLLVFLNLLNILTVFIWIFDWSWSNKFSINNFSAR